MQTQLSSKQPSQHTSSGQQSNPATAARFVGYYRVSTAKQGRSGLGLEAQQAAVADYVRSQNGALVRDFTEVESGKRNDRPELAKALAHARRTGATLVVAKLDRLSRNLAFLSALMEAKEIRGQDTYFLLRRAPARRSFTHGSLGPGRRR